MPLGERLAPLASKRSFFHPQGSTPQETIVLIPRFLTFFSLFLRFSKSLPISLLGSDTIAAKQYRRSL
jgi:hypothetical protein